MVKPKFEVGQKIVVCEEPRLGFSSRHKANAATYRHAEIVKVGHKWVHFSFGGHHKDKFNPETMLTEYEYGFQEHVFLSEADWRDWLRKREVWEAIIESTQSMSRARPPNGPTSADLEEALRLITKG